VVCPRTAERRRGLSRTEAAGRAWLPAAEPRRGGRASDGERRTSAQCRTASDGDGDEHGVAGASAAIIITVPNLIAGDTVRAAQC